MKLLLAMGLYLLVIIAFMQSWFLLMITALLTFSFWFGAVAFVPAAIVIDGYFGNYYGFPYLSICAVGWFLFVEYVRPKVVKLE
jgi:hypothetical protein